MPIFLRISSSSALEVFARSWPFIHTCPALGFSKPTRVRSSVLFPEPEPPKITSVCACSTSKLIPCRISRSPYCTRRSRTEITAPACADSFVFSGMLSLHYRTQLPITRKEKKRRKHEIHGNHHKDRNNHCLRRRAPNFFRSAAR